MNEFITQRFTKTDSTDLEPVCHEPPTLEQSLAWLNSQGECAVIALAHFNDQIASLQRELGIAKEINDTLMNKDNSNPYGPCEVCGKPSNTVTVYGAACCDNHQQQLIALNK